MGNLTSQSEERWSLWQGVEREETEPAMVQPYHSGTSMKDRCEVLCPRDPLRIHLSRWHLATVVSFDHFPVQGIHRLPSSSLSAPITDWWSLSVC